LIRDMMKFYSLNIRDVIRLLSMSILHTSKKIYAKDPYGFGKHDKERGKKQWIQK